MQKQKFSVKVPASLVNELSLALREAEAEGERIALGVANARERSSAVWSDVSEGRIAVKRSAQRLSDLSKAARGDAAIAALMAPLEDFVHGAREELDALEATHEEESRTLRALEAKLATNRALCAALSEALAACEVEGASSPVDETGGWSSVW